MERFGTLLRQLRWKHGTTLGELARYLGLSLVHLSEVERNERPPLSAEQIAVAAKLLGCEQEPLLLACSCDECDGPAPIRTTENPGLCLPCDARKFVAERNAKIERYSVEFMAGWSEGYQVRERKAKHHAVRMARSIRRLLEQRNELRKLLRTMVYWHRKDGHIDESWWDGAESLTREE